MQTFRVVSRTATAFSSLVVLAFACSQQDPANDDSIVVGGAAGASAGSGGARAGAAGSSAGSGAGVGGAAGTLAGAGTSGATSAGAGGSVAGAVGSGGSVGGTPSAGSAGVLNSAGNTSLGGNAGTGPGGSAGAAGQGGSAGSVSVETCSSGMKDGDETGVDCGGSCEACVPYQIDPPLIMNEAARSGCEANGSGFMCAQALVFSPYMVAAARDDWNTTEPPFVYGVVGHDPDPNGVDAASSNYASTCCQCYQLVFKNPTDGNVSMTPPKPMVVQAFNTYAGGPTAFDIFMAVGGHGNFNGCTANGQQYSGYPDTGGDWSGGVRATRYSQCSNMGYSESSVGSDACQSYVESECNKIQAPEPVQSISRESCIETNKVETHYHMNWNVVVKRVECPANLTRVTGCRLNDQNLPDADPAVDTVAEAMSSGFRDGYHTTTMQDCCRPTCAWPDNTENTAAPYSIFYSCNKEGEPYTQ